LLSLYRATVVIDLDTLRKVFKHGYLINAYCRSCDRHTFLDLAALIDAGFGERRVVGLVLRCSRCQSRAEVSLIWPGRRL
jgi:hypothetical protein